jgi:hypothetical protein
MQQMARMRLGWVCFLPASTAAAASLPGGDIVGALLFDKGFQGFGCGTGETDSDYSICQVISPARRMPGIMAVGRYAAASIRAPC